ncbi:hypothetical protein [Streptomyces ochraceiscleroticus]|uniref:Uncharacterized protein n=1 Tax=Streptomyces ochraceiscleroticus TaxID=47761 RepID=A0ABW1MLX4_9ACTN|nr:hypothetical protein [Streptomyces ochraceiscleroticus]
MPGNTIAVLDSGNRPLPKGQRGRVAIASYQLRDAYAIAEPDFLTHDYGGRTQRFLLTGDSGFIDQAGRPISLCWVAPGRSRAVIGVSRRGL